MENGPETTSQAPATASSTDQVVVEEVTSIDSAPADTVVADVEDEPVAITENMADTPAPDVQEAPAPQAVHLFDMGDDLGAATEITTPETAAESVVPNADEPESEHINVPDGVITLETNQELEAVALPLVNPVALPTDDEIFEQVMGSSRVEDIPVPRRSTPGSIPLPPQIAEEQARRERSAAPAPVDTRGRKHPLPAQQRSSQNQDGSGQAAQKSPQPSAPQAVDVICPKCQRTTSTRFTFCMKCGTDFPPGYIASLTGHSPQAATPSGRSGVRDTRSTVRQINRIHEAWGNGIPGHGMGTAQASGEEELPRLNAGMMANPFLVAFLSFLMPGLGHMLMGEYKKGLPWLFAGIAAMAFLPSWTFLMWVPLLLRVFSAINSYQLATIKQGEQQRGPFEADDDT